MNRLREIEERKAEIRKMIETDTKLNKEALDTLEKEVRALNEEKEILEKRMEILSGMKNGEIEATKIEKTDERKLNAEAKSDKPLKLFRNFAEQLSAIKRQTETGIMDERLEKIQKQFRANGMSEGVGTDGGFAVQTDFAGMMMESAVTAGNILPLVDRYEISGNSNSVKWVDIDETSVATTVYGGVQVYWAAEGASVTKSKPTLIEKKVELEKLMGVAYATYELDSDSSFISELYNRAFTTAIQRELENTIINGVGAGKPLGFLKGNNLVTVAKEAGQVAGTVVWENIVKLYNRSLNKQTSVWLINPDVQEQLDFLAFPVGVGGVPVYLGASSQGSLPALKGRPVIETDLCPALGTVGDINFVDLSQYMLVTKGGVQSETSIHVQFLTAENCFRFIFRANGLPKKNSALTLKNSSNTRSSFVTLATRA